MTRIFTIQGLPITTPCGIRKALGVIDSYIMWYQTYGNSVLSNNMYKNISPESFDLHRHDLQLNDLH